MSNVSCKREAGPRATAAAQQVQQVVQLLYSRLPCIWCTSALTAPQQLSDPPAIAVHKEDLATALLPLHAGYGCPCTQQRA